MKVEKSLLKKKVPSKVKKFPSLWLKHFPRFCFPFKVCFVFGRCFDAGSKFPLLLFFPNTHEREGEGVREREREGRERKGERGESE